MVPSIADWILWFIANVGGTAVVLAALFGWLGKRYLDRAQEKERYANEKRVLLYRTQFEVEFQAYQSIWSACAELMDHVARLLTLYDRSDSPDHPGIKAGFRNQADVAVQAAITSSERYAPFIAAEVMESATTFILAARSEVQAFSGTLAAEAKKVTDYSPEQALQEAKSGFAETKAKWRLVESSIRKRISVLSVIDT